jgi:hypothetical protein
MIGDVICEILGKARNQKLTIVEQRIKQQAVGVNSFELSFNNEIAGYFHVDSTPICCGSNIVNIVGDIPQDIVECFMECLSYTGMMYIVIGKVLPKAVPARCVHLSPTVCAFNAKNNQDVFRGQVSLSNPLGQGGFGFFAEQAKKRFPELKVSYNTLHGKTPISLSQIIRSFHCGSDLQYIGDNTLFVWGVNNIPANEAPLYLDIFKALHNVNDMLAISTERQFSVPKIGQEANLYTTKVLQDAGWPVLLQGRNPGGQTLLSIHGITKTPPVAVSAEPATK